MKNGTKSLKTPFDIKRLLCKKKITGAVVPVTYCVCVCLCLYLCDDSDNVTFVCMCICEIASVFKVRFRLIRPRPSYVARRRRCVSTPTSRRQRWRSCGAANARCISLPSTTPTPRPPAHSPALPPKEVLRSGSPETRFDRFLCKHGYRQVARRRT